MPELPEVEIARRQLDRWLVGRRIAATHLPDEAAVRTHLSTRPDDVLPGATGLVGGLIGSRVEATSRHGKRLGVVFDAGRAWAVHLGMSGRWVRREDGDAPRFARLGLEVEDGATVWFSDMRRFGCVAPVHADALDATLTAGHGPDALDACPDGPGLAARFRTRSAIKTALLQQERLAGLGNIHAVEALFRARIAPGRSAQGLTPSEWAALADAIPAQLRYALDVTEAEEVAYMTDGGHVENPFAVYGREGEACGSCGASVVRARHSGRSTFWCPGCQPDRAA